MTVLLSRISVVPPCGRSPNCIGRKRRILMVEPRHALPMALPDLVGAEVTHVGYGAISAALLARTTPDLVLTPLMNQAFDVLDVARLLKFLGYTGALRAIAPPLPNRHLIRTEIAAICPDLDFDLIEVSRY